MRHIILRSLLPALAVLALAACATQAGGGAVLHSKSRYQLDDEYMSLVARRAALHGVQIRWVNPPMKEVAAARTPPASPPDKS